MSLYTTTDQGPLSIPGGYATYGVQQTDSGLAAQGIVTLVGEADAGPDFTLESDLDVTSAVSPDQLSVVLGKYKSGPLVDAFMGVVQPSRDPEIPGAPATIKLIKTNPSTKATLALLKVGGSVYGTLQDNNWGKLGNLLMATGTALPAEVLPTTGEVTFTAPASSVTLNIRIDGGAAQPVTVTSGMTPAQFITAVNAAIPGVAAAGVTAAGVILSHPPGPVLDGFGKSLEILGTAPNMFNVLSSSTDAGILSSVAAPKLITSASEYTVSVGVTRSLDGLSETHTTGGDVPLQVGYLGTTATLSIVGVTGTPASTLNPGTTTKATTLSTTVTGGASPGGILSLDLSQFPTIQDLVNYLNAIPGYTAAVGSSALGLLPCSALDQGTYGICSTTAALPGRIKVDGYRFFNEMATSPACALQVQAPQGLPWLFKSTLFAGGTRGATTQATFQSAIDALRVVDTNFVVPLFSQNAAADILIGATDPASTYNIASINAYVLTHCLAMSKIQNRKNRQAMLSVRDTYVNAKAAAQALGAGQVALAFQDVVQVGSNGLTQFQPWMNAVTAAGMQAAGGYKAIFNKALNLNGAIQAARDFNYKDSSQITDALKAGLLVIRKRNGLRYVSDQTTYSKNDNNPVWNSIQAIYAANTVALTAAQEMENDFVGKTLSQISSAMALAKLGTIMDNMVQAKYLARSDDAPRGYKDAKVTIIGPTMQVEASIYLATSLYFVKIAFQINQVRQSSSQ